MDISLGTFNLNNLFSRFDFKADLAAADPTQPAIEAQTTFSFSDPASFVLRKYQGKLVKGKSDADRALLAERINRMDLDLLALQEVEDIDTLKHFQADELGGRYPHVVLIEGNDPRLIDVGLLSKLPLGAVTSWQHVPDPSLAGEPLFSRDLLQVDVLSADRSKRLLTLFVNHLKSKFVPFTEDPVTGTQKANEKRHRQAAGAVAIIAAEMRPDSRFAVVGDMNDTPDSAQLAPLATSTELALKNALADPEETRPAKHDDPPPPSKAWTHRFKESHKPASYELLDQIWLSPALAEVQTGAFIDRRDNFAGDGSDHDPAWVTLNV